MLEVVVAMVVIAILFGLITSQFQGARSDAQGRRAGEAASVYARAIEEFRQDHGGRAPILGAANDWPNAELGPVSLGGVALMDRGAPELVRDNIAGVAGTLDAAKGSQGAIVYSRTGEATWEIAVFVRAGDDWDKQCEIASSGRTKRAC
jgi:type II secretory pathway pseudopilin PulG